jgi:hypothetical protein
VSDTFVTSHAAFCFLARLARGERRAGVSGRQEVRDGQRLPVKWRGEKEQRGLSGEGQPGEGRSSWARKKESERVGERRAHCTAVASARSCSAVCPYLVNHITITDVPIPSAHRPHSHPILSLVGRNDFGRAMTRASVMVNNYIGMMYL